MVVFNWYLKWKGYRYLLAYIGTNTCIYFIAELESLVTSPVIVLQFPRVYFAITDLRLEQVMFI